jgi:hypothetical protein
MASSDCKLIRTADDQPWQLYDFAHDKAETRNLARDPLLIVTRLREVFAQWDREVHQ